MKGPQPMTSAESNSTDQARDLLCLLTHTFHLLNNRVAFPTCVSLRHIPGRVLKVSKDPCI